MKKGNFVKLKFQNWYTDSVLNPSWGEPPAKIFAVMPSFWRNLKQTFYLLQTCCKAVCGGGRGTVENMCYEVRRAEACVD